MADKKGFGMRTSSANNYYKLLSDSTTNIQDLPEKMAPSVPGRRKVKKKKGY